jgi:hypothetical protein
MTDKNTPPVINDLPLLTEEQYTSALAEIKSLFNSKQDSPEEKRLYLLTELCHNYEQHNLLWQVDEDDFDYESADRQRKPKGKKFHSMRKNGGA